MEVGLAGNALSAIDLLRSARAAGISVTLDRNTVVLEGPTEPSRDLLDELKRQKADIVAILQSETECVPKPSLGDVATEFLKEVKRTGANLFPVGGRLELRGGSPKLLAEFQGSSCGPGEHDRRRAARRHSF